MRRKNRKWVAMAVTLYLFVVWSAYRWGVAQRPTDGDIFEHIEREAKRKNAQESAKAAAPATRGSFGISICVLSILPALLTLGSSARTVSFRVGI